MPQPRKLLTALLAAAVAVAAAVWSFDTPEPTGVLPPRPEPAPTASTAPTPPPRPRVVRPMGQGQAIAVPLPDGRTLPLTLWTGQATHAPVIACMAGPNDATDGFVAVLETLRAHRDVAAAIVGSVAPRDIADPAARVRDLELRLNAVIAALKAHPSLQGGALVLLGAGDAAAAAVLAAQANAEVRATGLFSPLLEPPELGLRDAVGDLARRQVFLVYGSQGSQAEAGHEIAGRLLNRRVVVVPGGAAGVDLLRNARIRSDLAGWLYTALGPLQSPP